MDFLPITRVLAGPRRGSSRPILVDTPAGQYLVKLHGAAQGTGPLVAEIVVAALARALQLPILPWQLARLERDTPTDDQGDELADLLAASTGINLAIPWLPHAHDATPEDLARLSAHDRAAVLWLDRLVMNPDRTTRNPNVLWNGGKWYLIDHGSALWFQYNWADVTEAKPRATSMEHRSHLFEATASPEWASWDRAFASRITRTVLFDALSAVPESFLTPLLPQIEQASATARNESIHRRRAAYVAFLWKRLQPPRDYVNPT